MMFSLAVMAVLECEKGEGGGKEEERERERERERESLFGVMQRKWLVLK